MRFYSYKLWLILSATVFIFSGCQKETVILPEDQIEAFNLDDYSFVIDARRAADPLTRLDVSTATWQSGDQIYISLDGDDANVYMLKYDSGQDQWGVYNVPGASNAGFAANGTLAALYCGTPSLKMVGGKLQGTTLGDIVYTKSGTYSKSGRVITVSITLDQRPISILKVEKAGGASYVENMTNNHTSLTSLNDMAWDSGKSQVSYKYDSASDVAFCYGDLPEGGVVKLRHTGGDRQLFIRTYEGKSLATGKMATLQGPVSSESASWTETIDFEHYETGDVITYMSSAKAAPLNLVITGDGFTVYDMKPEGTFYARAKYAVDELFKVEPFKTYKNYFNVYFIPAISNQRGADIGNNKKDTFFDTGWESGTSYSTMASSTGRSTAYNFFASHTPGYEASRTFGIVLCNESTYGAICYWDAPVLCYASVALNSSWTAPRSLAWSGNWDGEVKEAGYCRGDYSNLVLHELGGHGIGRLSDEYPSYNFSSWTVQYQQSNGYSRNLSVGNTGTPWDSFKAAILAAGGYATGNAGIGEYECKNDIYRADFQGTMIDNRKTFGVWSRYLIAERIHSVAGESYSYDQFISEVPKQVYDDVWKSSRGASVRMVDEEELTFVPMPASPR